MTILVLSGVLAAGVKRMLSKENRWKMTARARLLGAFAFGAGFALMISASSHPFFVFWQFANAVGAAWCYGNSLRASRRPSETKDAFAIRLAAEHDVEVTLTPHRVYVVDAPTFHRLSETKAAINV